MSVTIFVNANWWNKNRIPAYFDLDAAQMTDDQLNAAVAAIRFLGSTTPAATIDDSDDPDATLTIQWGKDDSYTAYSIYNADGTLKDRVEDETHKAYYTYSVQDAINFAAAGDSIVFYNVNSSASGDVDKPYAISDFKFYPQGIITVDKNLHFYTGSGENADSKKNKYFYNKFFQLFF